MRLSCSHRLLRLMSPFAPEPHAAATTSQTSRARDGRIGLAVTVYNRNLGLVRERRTLTLEKGVNGVRYMDVAAMIDPRTVHLGVVDSADGLRVLEQNYEYDLISPDKLMEKFVGREVTLVFDDEGDGTRRVSARLVSINGGLVYEIDGQFQVNPPARVILPEIPGGLIGAPTLVWLIENSGPASRAVDVSYLTGGISWSADYVGVVDENDTRADLTGWVTIENNSGAGYEDATIKLVAGDVHRAGPEGREYARAMEMGVAAAQPAFEEESLFEYHLYTLDRPATVKDRQTKQIALMEAAGVPVRKIYLLSGQPSFFRGRMGGPGPERKVEVHLEMDNEAANGLGVPLPRGVVRLYKEDSGGSLQFIGEDRIDHTPKGETVTMKIGDAFDIVADRAQTDFRATSGGRYDAEMEFRIAIRNHKDDPVVVIIREPVPGDWKVLSSTHPHVARDASTIEFEAPVPPGGEAAVVYRVAVDWK